MKESQKIELDNGTIHFYEDKYNKGNQVVHVVTSCFVPNLTLTQKLFKLIKSLFEPRYHVHKE